MGGKSDAEATIEATRDTNKTNEKIAEQNLGYQYENLEYQKALQQKTFEREDTANQRAVNDMRAAGLSPLSQFNNASQSGAIIPTEAMHNDYQRQTPAMTRNAERIANLQLASNIINSVNDINQKQYQNAMLEQEIRGKKLQNDVYERTQEDTVNRAKIASLMDNEDLRKRVYDRRYMELYGIHDSDSREERIAKVLLHTISGGTKREDYNLSGITFKDMPSSQTLSKEDVLKMLQNVLPESAYNSIKTMFEDSPKRSYQEELKETKKKSAEYLNKNKNQQRKFNHK